MSDEWGGRERRTYSELREVVRDELKPIRQRQDEMREAQIEIERKITEWETAAKWFRIFVLGTVALVAALVKMYEWMADHLK